MPVQLALGPIHHLRLTVTDIQRSREFYTAVLGFQVAVESPPADDPSAAAMYPVLWGGIVMFVSGALLWANSIAMRFLPKSVLDVCTAVHWYEAVLATLAIVVWHLYSVILDPDVYPLDTAFITGHTVRQHEDEEGEDREPAPAHGD